MWKARNPDKVEDQNAEDVEGPADGKSESSTKPKKEKIPRPKGQQAPRRGRSTAGKDGFHPELILRAGPSGIWNSNVRM